MSDKEEKKKIQIKNRWTGVVIMDVEAETLIGADLSGANLTGADLTGADLTGADLSGADLSGADLRYVRYFYRAIFSCIFIAGVKLKKAED